MDYCVYCMNEANGNFCTYCGKKQEEYKTVPHHLPVGSVLNKKYLIGTVLGEGGFGITYIGRDLNLDLKVAVKEYYPFGAVNRNCTSSMSVTANLGDLGTQFEKGRKNFLSEARTLARFANEPNVVTVRDFFEENNTAYIVMDYLEGEDLRVYLGSNGRMSFFDAFAMLSPVMDALKRIHLSGLIHRDISPSNIMIMKDRTVKLLDFGAARNAVSSDEKSLSVMLKPGFAPEEQYRTKGSQGPWTDVYALSATLYKMVTGVTPDDAMNRLFSDEVKLPHLINPQITEAQSAVIMKGMAIYQKDRFMSVDELKSALSDCENYDVKPSFAAQGSVINEKTVDGSDYSKSDVRKYPEEKKASKSEVNAARNNSQLQLVKKGKKPQVWGFIGSIVAGLVADFNIFSFIGAMGDPALETADYLGYGIYALIFATIAVICGYFYYPRVEKESKKPRVVAFISSCVLMLVALVLMFVGFFSFGSDLATQGTGESFLSFAVLVAIPAVYLGYFYYPRLEKKKRKLFFRLYGSAAAAIAVFFVIYTVFFTASTVSIGDQKIKKDAQTVEITADLLTDNDIEELKKLKKLENLLLNACFLDNEDIKTIADMTQLKKLDLTGNTDISDISPLKNLKELTYLDLELTGVEDISCLDELTSLRDLSLSKTKVKDLSVLKELIVLETLHMDNLSDLDGSTLELPLTVQSFYCSNSGLTNIDFLDDNIALSTVVLSENKLTDISALSSKHLFYANVSNNQITDISPVSGASSGIIASGNKISDISSLKGTKAKEIKLSNNQISDISVFEENNRITTLELANNRISDISALKDCFNIFSLNLDGNLVEDISALATVDNLNILNLRNNKISDISPLAQNENYIYTEHAIYLQNNQITDISPLTEFRNSDYIVLDDNLIEDISPLISCKALEHLSIKNNKISDLSVLSGADVLRVVNAVGNPVNNVDGLNLVSGETILEKSVLSLCYTEEIDWAQVKTLNIDDIRVYDIPPRQQSDMEELGYRTNYSTEGSEESDG